MAWVWAIAGCGGFLTAFGEDPSPDTSAVDGGTEATAGDAIVDAASGETTVGDEVSSDVDAGGPVLHVFVTSSDHPATAIAQADTLCAQAAFGLGRGHWYAWVSSSSREASAVLAGDGPWVTMAGALVATNRNDLFDGRLQHPIDRDENGAPRSAFVWTGTSTTGQSLPTSCSDWSDASASLLGAYGRSDETGTAWTYEGDISCANTFAVYCFEAP